MKNIILSLSLVLGLSACMQTTTASTPTQPSSIQVTHSFCHKFAEGTGRVYASYEEYKQDLTMAIRQEPVIIELDEEIAAGVVAEYNAFEPVSDYQPDSVEAWILENQNAGQFILRLDNGCAHLTQAFHKDTILDVINRVSEGRVFDFDNDGYPDPRPGESNS
jgi:ABC-type Fe3+-hydroxamate transport system substrate-binding protein